MKVILAPLKTQEHQKIPGAITHHISFQGKRLSFSLRVLALLPLLLTLGVTSMMGASATTSTSKEIPTIETPTTPRQAYIEYLNDRKASEFTQSYELKMSEGTSMEAIIREGQPGDYHYSAVIIFALEQEKSPKKSQPYCYVSTDELLELINYQKNPHQEESNISYDDTNQKTENIEILKKQLLKQALQIDSKLKTNLLSWNVNEHIVKTQESSADTPNITTSNNIFEEMVTGLGFLLLMHYHHMPTGHTTHSNLSHQLEEHDIMLNKPQEQRPLIFITDKKGTSSDRLPSHLLNLIANSCLGLFNHLSSITNADLPGKLSIGHEVKTIPITKKTTTWGEDLYLHHLLHPGYRPEDSSTIALMHSASSLKRPTSPIEQGKSSTSSSSSDPPFIVTKKSRDDKSYSTQPSTIATSNASSSQSILPDLEDLKRQIITFLKNASEKDDKNIILGYEASLARLQKAIQAINDGNETLSSYYQGSAIALLKTNEAKNKQADFYDLEKVATFEQLQALFDQAAKAYEENDYEIAKEWGLKAQFFAQLSKIRGFGIFDPNNFGQQPITTLNMIEMIRNNIITQDFLEECRVYFTEIEYVLSNEISTDLNTLEKKIKLVESLSEQSHDTNLYLKGFQEQLAEIQESKSNTSFNLNTQKDLIQNKINAFEAMLLTPRTKKEFLHFLNSHKDALTNLKESLLSFLEESEKNRIQAILENLCQEDSQEDALTNLKESLLPCLKKSEKDKIQVILEKLRQEDTREDTLTNLKESLLSFLEESKENRIQAILENLWQEYTASQDQENSCTLTLNAAERIRDVCLRGDVERINALIPVLQERTEYRSLAAKKEDQEEIQEAIYWNNAADACLCKAGALAKNSPDEKAAEAYGESAEYCVQAAKAEALKKTLQAVYWYNAGKVCYKQAEELIKNPFHDKAAEAYGQLAQYYAQAAEAEALKKTQEAIYWYHVGEMYRKKAKELIKNPPHEKAAEAYGQSAQYCKNAAEAEALKKTREAIYWNNAGKVCYKQAEELIKNKGMCPVSDRCPVKVWD